MPVEREPKPLFCPDSLERRNPPLNPPFAPLFEPLRALPFELPFPVNDRDVAVFVFPRAEKKCWFCGAFRIVDGAAGRPLAEKLSRLGFTGNLPLEKCAFRNCV